MKEQAPGNSPVGLEGWPAWQVDVWRTAEQAAGHRGATWRLTDGPSSQLGTAMRMLRLAGDLSR